MQGIDVPYHEANLRTYVAVCMNNHEKISQEENCLQVKASVPFLLPYPFLHLNRRDIKGTYNLNVLGHTSQSTALP